VRNSLLKSSDEAFLGPQILTFANFAEQTITNSTRRIHPISRLQKRHLLRQVVEILLETKKLRHYSRVANTAGFLAQVDELIVELKRQDLWPEHFEKLCRLPQDHDLAHIYELYQQHLNDNDLYDAEGRFWEARRYLSETAAADQNEFNLIVVDGFSDFTSAQYDILELLSKRAAETILTLTLAPEYIAEGTRKFDGRSLLFAKTKKTLLRLSQKFPDLQIELESKTHISEPALDHLERNLFRDPHELDSLEPKTNGIEILAANGTHGEIEEIARRIKSLLLRGQIRPNEVIVAFRSWGDVAGRISEVFADHGIPFSMEPWQSLNFAPLFCAIVSLLRLHDEDWPFGQLLSVVGNRLFRAFDMRDEGTDELSQDARIAIERCLRSALLPSGRRALLDQIRRGASSPVANRDSLEKKTPRDEKKEKFTLQAKLAFEKLANLASLLEQLPPKARLSEWILHLERLLVGLDALPKPGESSAAQRDKILSSWNLLRKGLRSIEMGNGRSASDPSELTLNDLMNLLETVGSELQMPAEHDAVGRVRILNAEAARYVSAKHVFLAGLRESSFSPAEAVDSFFNARNFDQDTTLQSRAGDEMLLFYELATRATEKLTLSYPALDAKGQTLSPSPLLKELEQCFGETRLPLTSMPLGEDPLGENESRTPWSGSGYRRQAVALALEGDRTWLAGIIARPESAQLGNAILSGISCVALRGKRDLFGPFDGILQSDRAKAVLAKRFDSSHLWSPSQLEGYATCPFRFFAEQLLSLEPPSELTLRSDVRRRGSLLHQVLATLHQHLSSVKEVSEDQSQLIERFHTVLNEAVASAPLEGLQRWLREIERREIEAWAEKYAEQETNYRSQWSHLDQPLRPALFEVRFGPEVRSSDSVSEDHAPDENPSTTLPFELDLGSEQILLTGQIDRVDVGRVGQTTIFNIIDYKSGAEVKLKDEKIRSGRQLQLPLYALAAERLLLADQDAVALSTGYWSIQGQGFASGRSGSALEIRELQDQKIQTSQQWDQLQPLILQRIAQLVSSIRSGQFPVFNEDENCIRSCSFSTICRVAHVRSLEKQWDFNDEARMMKHE